MATRIFILAILVPSTWSKHLALYQPTDVFSTGVTFTEGRESAMPADDFTMSMWVRFSSKNGDMRLVMSDYRFAITINNANTGSDRPKIEAYLSGASYSSEMASAITGDAWAFVALRFHKASQKLSFFRDGVLLGDAVATNPPFGGGRSFGPGAIEVLYFGMIASYSDGAWPRTEPACTLLTE